MKMAGIVFGDDYVKDNTVLVSITNCNSPLVWDATMLDAMKVYARHNQPLILAPSRSAVHRPRRRRSVPWPRSMPRRWRAWPSPNLSGPAARKSTGSSW